MKKLTQQEFETWVARQKMGQQGKPENDIREVELSGFSVAQDLDAITIALSTLSGLTFGANSSLYGSTWIGNLIKGCHFVDTPMSKSEMLDCVVEDSVFRNTALFRADLSGTVFKHCTLEALDLSSACLINTSFENCTFSNVQLSPSTSLSGQKSIAFDVTGHLLRTS
jgi:uncharacterized protein YjbI with pentapeptide repeats